MLSITISQTHLVLHCVKQLIQLLNKSCQVLKDAYIKKTNHKHAKPKEHREKHI